MQHVLAAVHHRLFGRDNLQLIYTIIDNEATLVCRCSSSVARAIKTALHAQYPDCAFHAVDGDPFALRKRERRWRASLWLCPALFPLVDGESFDDLLTRISVDPLSTLLATLKQGTTDPTSATVVVNVRAATQRQRKRLLHISRQLTRSAFLRYPILASLYIRLACGGGVSRCCAALMSLFAGPIASRAVSTAHLQSIQDRAQRHLFRTSVQLTATAPQAQKHRARERVRTLAGVFNSMTVAGNNRFALSFAKRHLRRTFLLSDAEVAMLWHPPTSTVKSETLARVESRELPPPTVLSMQNTSERGEGLVLGRVQYRDDRRLVAMPSESRYRHTFIVGKTGMGKSTLLENLIAADIQAGRGVGLIDPHGDLAETVLRLVPRHRTNDVVLFDVGDREHPIAFNPLDCQNEQQRPLVASGIVSAVHKMNPDSWGPRLEDILRNACLALCEVPGASLLSLSKMLSDANFRSAVLEKVSDPIILDYWRDEFGRWRATDQAIAVASVQNKVRPFLSHPILRSIVGRRANKLDLRRIMDDQKTLIVNLSKGRVGEDAASLLGSFLISGIQQAAMSRASVSIDQRPGFHLYVDEFQNFATDSFATILSEARKYRLSLTLANQYLYQIKEQSPQTLAAVFGNVGSIIAFQVGNDDAEELSRQLTKTEGDLLPNDLTNLPKYTAFLRLLMAGIPSRPFSIKTLPPHRRPSRPADRAAIRRTSHRRYGCLSSPVDASSTQVSGDIEQSRSR
jgi:hypothetical protein